MLWDKLHRKINHSMVVEKLKTLNIFSNTIPLNVAQGMKFILLIICIDTKTNHIILTIVCHDLIGKLKKVEIGTYEQWVEYSDHSPVIVSFNL
jgi:hypothetical protein